MTYIDPDLYNIASSLLKMVGKIEDTGQDALISEAEDHAAALISMGVHKYNFKSKATDCLFRMKAAQKKNIPLTVEVKEAPRKRVIKASSPGEESKSTWINDRSLWLKVRNALKPFASLSVTDMRYCFFLWEVLSQRKYDRLVVLEDIQREFGEFFTDDDKFVLSCNVVRWQKHVDWIVDTMRGVQLIESAGDSGDELDWFGEFIWYRKVYRTPPHYCPGRQSHRLYLFKLPGKANYYLDVPGDTIEAFPTINRGHPCEMPLKVPLHVIKGYCPPGGLVFDPFFGSGAVARAVIPLDCRVIACDNKLKYFKLAKKWYIEECQGACEVEEGMEELVYNDRGDTVKVRKVTMRCLDINKTLAIKKEKATKHNNRLQEARIRDRSMNEILPGFS